jgi:hypothetical protein
MLSLFRHNISLLASLAILLAGLTVAAYGLVHFFGSTILYSMISAHPLAETQGFKSVAALMVIGQHGITVLAGLTLAHFAGRSFAGTWRAGPPDDDSVVGRSALSKSVAMLLYGAGALYGSYGIIFGMGPVLDDYQLAIHGDRTTAQIVRVEPAPDIHWDVQRVIYQFTTRDGQDVRGTWNAFSFPVRQAQERGWIEVTYNTQNPAHSEAEFSFSMQFALYFFGGQLLFVVIGIWGFAKNAAALTDRPPPPPEIQPAPGPMRRGPVPPAAPARRAQFGRRGL